MWRVLQIRFNQDPGGRPGVEIDATKAPEAIKCPLEGQEVLPSTPHQPKIPDWPSKGPLSASGGHNNLKASRGSRSGAALVLCQGRGPLQSASPVPAGSSLHLSD